MKIVSFKICPFVQRVTALLAVKGADYDIEYIDLSHKPQWFLEISPSGQVPVLITDDGRVVFESDAIVEYIDEVVGAPTLSHDPVERAQDRAWSYLASKHYLVQCSAQRSSDRATLYERAGKLSKAFEKITARLGDSRFAHGDVMGAIDIAWLPLLHRAAIIEAHSGYDFLAEFPIVKRWQATILATGFPQQSVAEDFELRFTSFYLAETTYLGELTKARKGTACCGDPQCTVDDLACCA